MKTESVENDSDEKLVDQVLQGKKQFYAMLVDRYQRPVFNLMYRYCRSDREAADLSQDVFLRAYERLPSFDNRRKFFPWFYTIAMNRARDWQRKNSRRQKQLAQMQWEVEVIDPESHQEKQLLSREETRHLYSALDSLPDITREMLLLRYRQERPINELADIFGISESAVKMRISRAFEQMRNILGAQRDER